VKRKQDSIIRAVPRRCMRAVRYANRYATHLAADPTKASACCVAFVHSRYASEVEFFQRGSVRRGDSKVEKYPPTTNEDSTVEPTKHFKRC